MDSHPLFQPFRLKSLELKNRIVMAPMTRSFSPGGVPISDVTDYHDRRTDLQMDLQSMAGFLESLHTESGGFAESMDAARPITGKSCMMGTMITDWPNSITLEHRDFGIPAGLGFDGNSMNVSSHTEACLRFSAIAKPQYACTSPTTKYLTRRQHRSLPQIERITR